MASALSTHVLQVHAANRPAKDLWHEKWNQCFRTSLKPCCKQHVAKCRALHRFLMAKTSGKICRDVAYLSSYNQPYHGVRLLLSPKSTL